MVKKSSMPQEDLPAYKTMQRTTKIATEQPLYQQAPEARHIGRPVRAPASGVSEEESEMSRRHWIKIVGGILLGSALAAAGLSFSAGREKSHSSDPNAYEGTVLSLVKSDSNGDIFYYTDLCHTADENSSGSLSFYGIGLKKGDHGCSSGGAIAKDLIAFLVWPEKTYEAKTLGEESMTGKQIFLNSTLGRKVVFRKGEEVDKNSVWLDKVYSFE